jgi:hypothetical protein
VAWTIISDSLGILFETAHRDFFISFAEVYGDHMEKHFAAALGSIKKELADTQTGSKSIRKMFKSVYLDVPLMFLMVFSGMTKSPTIVERLLRRGKIMLLSPSTSNTRPNAKIREEALRRTGVGEPTICEDPAMTGHIRQSLYLYRRAFLLLDWHYGSRKPGTRGVEVHHRFKQNVYLGDVGVMKCNGMIDYLANQQNTMSRRISS